MLLHHKAGAGFEPAMVSARDLPDRIHSPSGVCHERPPGLRPLGQPAIAGILNDASRLHHIWHRSTFRARFRRGAQIVTTNATGENAVTTPRPAAHDPPPGQDQHCQNKHPTRCHQAKSIRSPTGLQPTQIDSRNQYDERKFIVRRSCFAFIAPSFVFITNAADCISIHDQQCAARRTFDPPVYST